jgi:SRSO17 transposase
MDDLGTPQETVMVGSQWRMALADLQERIGPRFVRPEVRQRAIRYLTGLLGRVERRNGWQLAEHLGEAGPQGVQRLLNGARWDAEVVRDDLRAYVVEHLGADDGILILDETGFVKKGRHSCGVASQYTGTTGDVRNAQVGVFLAYASRHGAAFIDRALFLPRAWTTDPARRAVAGVPSSVRFATKIELAKRMLERAFAAEAPAHWVVGDSFYGRSHALRHWLEAHHRSYILMVPSTNAVRHDGRRWQVAALAATLPDSAWNQSISSHGGANDEPYAWACLPVTQSAAAGRRHWLVARRCLEDPADHTCYLAYGPAETSDEALVGVCRQRWIIEECFAQAKGEVGLDQYEVRTWTAWHRYVTLGLLAHAALVVARLAAHRAEEPTKKGLPVLVSSR